MDQITIGYLSWKRHNILEQTLNSHKILNVHKLIYFQEISDTDISIAKKFNINNFLGTTENIGILKAFIKLVNNCETEYFIFSENDWLLIEDEDKTNNILIDCINMLNNNITDIIRLRHSIHPGEPLYSRPRDVNKWTSCVDMNFPYKLESLSWLDYPNKYYNNLLEEYNGNYKWYITTNKHQVWSNNIFIAKTSYLREFILPILKKSMDNTNKYDGMEKILVHNNNINIRIAGGEGLFKHQDKLINC